MNDALAPVLVTGATGNVGREVVAALQALGVPWVAAGTRPPASRHGSGRISRPGRSTSPSPGPMTRQCAACAVCFFFALRPSPMSRRP